MNQTLSESKPFRVRHFPSQTVSEYDSRIVSRSDRFLVEQFPRRRASEWDSFRVGHLQSQTVFELDSFEIGITCLTVPQVPTRTVSES